MIPKKLLFKKRHIVGLVLAIVFLYCLIQSTTYSTIKLRISILERQNQVIVNNEYKSEITIIESNSNSNVNESSTNNDIVMPRLATAEENEIKNETTNQRELPTCYMAHESLLKSVDFKNEIQPADLYDFAQIQQRLESQRIFLRPGGRWSPDDCKPKYKIAVIVPYRNRLDNLKEFALNMHPFFARQKMDYGIYVIEPAEHLTFNRGLLMNIGYLEALKDSSDYWDCFFFHDVDMIPLDIRNIYMCNDFLPVHYAVAIDKWEFKWALNFFVYYGGVNAYTTEQFKKINGFSNSYFGWGGEDDDLRKRTEITFNSYVKAPSATNMYYMGKHFKQSINPERESILSAKANQSSESFSNEGLTTVKYNVKEIQKNMVFTHILVDHPPKPWA